MRKILTNYRYYVLVALFTIAIIGIFSEPMDDLPFMQWLCVMLSTKIVGFGSGYVGYKLIQRWEARGTIEEFKHFTDNY